MVPGLLMRSRLLSVGACAVFVMVSAGAGCSTSTPAVTVSGKTLSIYLSAPASLSSNPQELDVVHAEQLAFNQLKGQVQGQGYTLTLRVLTANKVSDNARAAIDDTSSVAYLGEVQPGDSVDSLGITNAQDLLQVSPAEAASAPTKDFESFSTYGRTFASLAPNSPALGGATAGGKAFADAFQTAYGHKPSSQAVLGYLAMAAVLKALHNAGSSANNRGTVRDDFFALKSEQLSIGGAVLGTYTVDKDGTVTITAAS